MYNGYSRKDPPRSSLERYCARLGHMVERRHAEAALIAARYVAEYNAEGAQEAMIEAQAANRSKSEFLATVSHELKTPLNSIIGFSDIIRSGQADKNKQQIEDYAQNIFESGHRLLDVITEILDMSRIEAGRVELSESKVDVGTIVETCLSLVQSRAERSGVKLSAEIKDDVPHLYADEQRIKQILLNLLSNAIKFTPEKGEVTVDARTDDEGRLMLEVSDTGLGIAAEDIPKILKPFLQVDGKLSRKYEGIGLGLPIAAALVELHGGDLVISSALHKGTRVTVILPERRVRHTTGSDEAGAGCINPTPDPTCKGADHE